MARVEAPLPGRQRVCPSTYLKPCDEVYYVKDVPEAIPSVLKANSTSTVDGDTSAAGKSDDAEVSGIQSEVTSSSKAVVTTEPKPSRAVKSNSTTRPISTAKRANQLVKTKSKPLRDESRLYQAHHSSRKQQRCKLVGPYARSPAHLAGHIKHGGDPKR